MMKAVVVPRLGGPEVLELADQERPEPQPTEVLVRVAAAGLNPADWQARESGLPIGDVPFTAGWDVAGTVEDVGFGVTLFAPGDRVFGMVGFPHAGGTCAEFVTAPARQLAATPDGVSDVQAAALPLSSLTAWQVLVDTAHVTTGDRVLVLAAAGGVGSLVVQIAKSRGAWVAGTASRADREYVLSLGADEVFDYHGDITASVSEVDVVVDLVGGQVGVDAVPCVRDGGLLVTVPHGQVDIVPIKAAAEGRIRTTPFLVEPDHEGMENVAALAGAGQLTARVTKTFPLAETAAAHEAVRQGAGGKVVVTVDH